MRFQPFSSAAGASRSSVLVSSLLFLQILGSVSAVPLPQDGLSVPETNVFDSEALVPKAALERRLVASRESDKHPKADTGHKKGPHDGTHKGPGVEELPPRPHKVRDASDSISDEPAELYIRGEHHSGSSGQHKRPHGPHHGHPRSLNDEEEEEETPLDARGEHQNKGGPGASGPHKQPSGPHVDRPRSVDNEEETLLDARGEHKHTGRPQYTHPIKDNKLEVRSGHGPEAKPAGPKKNTYHEESRHYEKTKSKPSKQHKQRDVTDEDEDESLLEARSGHGPEAKPAGPKNTYHEGSRHYEKTKSKPSKQHKQRDVADEEDNELEARGHGKPNPAQPQQQQQQMQQWQQQSQQQQSQTQQHTQQLHGGH